MRFLTELNKLIFFYKAHKIMSYASKSVYTAKFAKYIPRDKIRTIIEIGARDLRDTLAMKLYYSPDRVFSFEANPFALSICAEAIKKYWMFSNKIYLIPKAVWSHNRIIKFNSVQARSGTKSKANIGSSSCFEGVNINENEEAIQIVDVEAIRLDDFCREYSILEIDLLCMDIEGAEYNALIGLGEYVNKVKYIITELHYSSKNSDFATFDKVKSFLEIQGFCLIDKFNDGNPSYSNFLFSRG